MASPRRFGRDRDRGGEDEDAPPPAKPVRPVVPPVVPPMVRPVAPSVPPVARPVAPAVPPVARPVAPPSVAPVVAPTVAPSVPPSVRPVAAPAAAPTSRSSSGSARRVDEEEIGRGGRASHARSSAGGSGLGLKVGLAAGLVALAVTAAAVFSGGGGGDAGTSDAEGAFVEQGVLAARTLASTDPSWWNGAAPTTGTDPLKQARKVLSDLFGETGTSWFDETNNRFENPKYDKMDPDEKTKAAQERDRYLTAKDKLTKAGPVESGPGTKGGQATTARLVTTQSPKVYGAWVRTLSQDYRVEGDWLASYPDKSAIAYEYAKGTQLGSGLFHVAGSIAGQGQRIPVRVFGAPIPGGRADKPLMAYVALWEGAKAEGESSGGGGALKWVLLILAPLLVGGIAAAVASSHTKSLRDLTRELDRLGTSGDPGRTIRTHGAEATRVARAVERMVGNLEFRQKHGSADLGEIVDKEKRVAEEIHGALMAKNPPRLSDYEVETLFKPGFEIAGDHFEYFRIDQDHLGVILLDTNVRGIPASLLMAATKSYVKAAAPGNLSPADVLRQVNRNLAGDIPPGRHVTAFYAVIDTSQGKVVVASAGHLPLIVYRHATGKVAKLNPEGIALGLDVGPVFERALQEAEVSLGIGDRIVIYTDGALKVQNETGEEFGELRFYQAVAREAPKNSQAFVNFVGSAIDQFHLQTQQNDDITLSTVKRLK